MEQKRITDIPGLMYLWKVDNLYLAGQPSPDSWAAIKELGVSKVYNLRAENEMDFSGQEKIIKDLGLEYEQFPIVNNGELVSENCDRLGSAINEKELQFIHCGSANRVAGWLMVYLVKYRNMSFDEAVEIAQQNGLSNPGFIEQAEKILGL